MQEEISAQNNKHIGWVDIAKGIAIILVIIGHCFRLNEDFRKFIYLFHMPVFFVLAGYLFNFDKYKNNFLRLVLISAKRLLLPALVATVIIYHSFSKKVIISFLYGIGFKYCLIPSIGYGLWFLFCLFVLRILLFFFIKTVNFYHINKFICVLFSFTIALLGCMIGQKIFLPWNIDIALVCLYFAYLGYLIKQKDFLNIKPVFKFLLCIATLFMLYIDFNYGRLDMNRRIYINPLISLNVAVLASVLLFFICQSIQNLNRFKITNKIILFLKYMGINSILVIPAHMVPFSLNYVFPDILSKIIISITTIECFARLPFLKTVFQARTFLSLSKDITYTKF